MDLRSAAGSPGGPAGQDSSDLLKADRRGHERVRINRADAYASIAPERPGEPDRMPTAVTSLSAIVVWSR